MPLRINAQIKELTTYDGLTRAEVLLAAKNISYIMETRYNKCEELVASYTNYAIDALNVFEDTSFLKALAKSLTERRT